MGVHECAGGRSSPTACGGFSCVMSFKVTAWQPSFQYNVGQEVLDSNLNIEVAENSGTHLGTDATFLEHEPIRPDRRWRRSLA
jgi:hypothetical protein